MSKIAIAVMVGALLGSLITNLVYFINRRLEE